MLVDRYQGQHSTTSECAVQEFEKAVFAVAAHRPAGCALQAALSADQNFVAGLALKGLGAVLLGKAEDLIAGQVALGPARAALAKAGGGTGFERVLVDVLALASAGSFKAAAARVEARLGDHPKELICLKIANALRFMSGDTSQMLAITSVVLPHWRADDTGYGFLLGLHAFGLEEAGAFSEADTVGREAVLSERADVWGHHAVSHVMEMRCQPRDGARWIEASRGLWPHCNNFKYHLAWHLALFRLELNEHDAVLDLYDRDICPTHSDDYRDLANATSLLWRLEQDGVSIGTRWQLLHEKAHKRCADTTYVFATLHYLLALLGAGDRAAAADLMEELRARALGSCKEDQAEVAATLGVPLAGSLMRWHAGGELETDLADVARRLPTLGGSFAQRDVFLRTLLLIAADAGEAKVFDAVYRARKLLKTGDRFAQIAEERLCRGTALKIPAE